MVPVEDIHRLIKKLQIEPSSEMDRRVHNIITEAIKESEETNLVNAQSCIWRKIIKNPITKIAAAASFLVVVSFTISFILYGRNVDLRNELELAQQDISTAPIEDSVTINFYLEEHQDFIARKASLNSAAEQSIQMLIDYDDIMYYEFLGDDLEFLNPGMIVKGPSSQQEIESSESHTISNGHQLTISEARETANFNLLILHRFYPGYMLDQIRKIDGRDALQLLYTNGINSVSLFEQPLDGESGLSHQEFREYAVYNKGEEGSTILAWRDNALSYVLIGNIKISQLMDMAQSINYAK